MVCLNIFNEFSTALNARWIAFLLPGFLLIPATVSAYICAKAWVLKYRKAVVRTAKALDER
jgi:hypothetical protein